jgi:hypothetical protein
MQLARIIAAFAMALIVDGAIRSAAAQDWVEYENREYGFSINFPLEPAVEDVEYSSPTGKALPARVFSAVEDGAQYRVTVVDFSSLQGEQHVAIAHATDAMRARGEVIFEVINDLDENYGPQFLIAEPGGREILSTIVFFNERLYIAEGNVAAGSAPPSQFQQSMTLILPDGSRPNGGGRNENREARERAYEEQLRQGQPQQ